MLRIAKPNDIARDVFLKCIQSVKDRELKARLISAEPQVSGAAAQFETAASSLSLHSIPGGAVTGDVSSKELTAVYNYRMVPKASPGRGIYDKLINVSGTRCPLCAVRDITTLDHHLPKGRYPLLSVVPANLVPACTDCNRAKLERFPTEAREQTLHPYFDDIEEHQWLAANVREEAPAALEFFVNSLGAEHTVLEARIIHHFRLFKLAALYASHCAEEITSIRLSITNLYEQSGVDAVEAHLDEQADSREAVGKNSWRAVTYRTLAKSRWFCEGGFKP